jgi:hypothetical protein
MRRRRTTSSSRLRTVSVAMAEDCCCQALQ